MFLLLKLYRQLFFFHIVQSFLYGFQREVLLRSAERFAVYDAQQTLIEQAAKGKMKVIAVVYQKSCLINI